MAEGNSVDLLESLGGKEEKEYYEDISDQSLDRENEDRKYFLNEREMRIRDIKFRLSLGL